MFSEQIGKKGLQMKIVHQNDAIPPLLGDPTRLKQILINYV